MLQIRLFGKPQVICDGTDITPELGNKGCALLCILFLRGGDYYAREKLAAYLWPDSAASAAKYNLRYTLWKIKKSTDIGEGGRSLIKLDREYCCIDRAYDYVCDLQTIDEIDPETQSADELKRACDAFGGELLEGYYFNHCEDLNELILSQRIYYEKRKNRLLMKAAELYEQRDMLPEELFLLLDLHLLFWDIMINIRKRKAEHHFMWSLTMTDFLPDFMENGNYAFFLSFHIHDSFWLF